MNKYRLEMIKRDCEEILSESLSLLLALKGESILITGGTGFMGTWLVEMVTFLNDNYNFNTKLILLSERAYNFSEKAPHLAFRKDILLIEKDIRNVLEVPEETTFIIHAAASPDNRLHATDPHKVINVIVKGTDSILSAASRHPGIKKILNISSGLIYGPQPLDLFNISEKVHSGPDCNSISSAYSEAKRLAEILCSAYRSQFKLVIVTARPFAFIGPYQLLDKPWAVNNFIRDSLTGGPIRIFNEETVRSYMYPSDMAFWLLRILVDGVSGAAYNVGSPHGITLIQLANKISSNLPLMPKINLALNRGNSQRSIFVPDVTLAEKSLGLRHKVDIDEAIERTLLWHKTS